MRLPYCRCLDLMMRLLYCRCLDLMMPGGAGEEGRGRGGDCKEEEGSDRESAHSEGLCRGWGERNGGDGAAAGRCVMGVTIWEGWQWVESVVLVELWRGC